MQILIDNYCYTTSKNYFTALDQPNQTFQLSVPSM
jgi:hypothetical protein